MANCLKGLFCFRPDHGGDDAAGTPPKPVAHRDGSIGESPRESLPTATAPSRDALLPAPLRLWNEAYESLKQNDGQLVEAYEKILNQQALQGILPTYLPTCLPTHMGARSLFLQY